jgi:xanthine/uracil permease
MAVQWLAIIVPPAFGFWAVAGDLAGLTPEARPVIYSTALLGLGVATALQLRWGYRVPVFEGPGSIYFATLAVAAGAGGITAPHAVGGMLIAAATILGLAATGLGRSLHRLFSAPVMAVFILTIAILALPATLRRALELNQATAGSLRGWTTLAIVLAVSAVAYRLGHLAPYWPLVGLASGIVAAWALGGASAAPVDGGALPELLPWETPRFSVELVLPYAVAGVLSALNAIASVSAVYRVDRREGERVVVSRGLAVNGLGQAFSAATLGLMGTVPRLGSVVIPGTVDARRRGLMGAAAALICIAFIPPVVQLLAAIPATAAAALTTTVFLRIIGMGWGQVRAIPARRRRLVILPSILVPVVFLAVAGFLPSFARLLLNPFLITMLVAAILDRAVRHES